MSIRGKVIGEQGIANLDELCNQNAMIRSNARCKILWRFDTARGGLGRITGNGDRYTGPSRIRRHLVVTKDYSGGWVWGKSLSPGGNRYLHTRLQLEGNLRILRNRYVDMQRRETRSADFEPMIPGLKS